MTDHSQALEELRRLLASNPRLRERTLAAAASGELEQITTPDEDTTMNGSEQVSLRLPTALLERCDALVEDLQAHPDLAAMGRVTRASVVRLALERGLQQLEDTHTKGKRRR